MTAIASNRSSSGIVAIASTLLLFATTTALAIDTSGYVLEDAQDEIDAGNFEDAVMVLEEIIDVDGETADSLNLMGYSLRNLDRNDEAMDFYKRALAMEPDHQGTLEYQGELFLKIGDQAAAEANLAQLSKLCPDGCDAHGILQTAIGRFKDGGQTSGVRPSQK